MKYTILIYFIIFLIISISIAIVFMFWLEKERASSKTDKDKTVISNKNSYTLNDYNQDYDIYIMPKGERILCICLASMVVFMAAFIFYRSYTISFAILPIALFYPRIKIKEIIKKRKYNLNLQFRDLLYSLSASLMAGKSIESAFKTSLNDLSIQYPEQNTDIIREVRYIIHRIEMNCTIEEAVKDFSNRAKVEDIENFINVFNVCKRTGGDLVQVIKTTTEIINEKIQIKHEIENLIAQRKFEQKVLGFLPFALIALISISAADFMAPVFTTIQGRISMTIAIALFIAAYFVSKKLMNIEV